MQRPKSNIVCLEININSHQLIKQKIAIFKIIIITFFCSGFTNLFSQAHADFSASTVSGCSPIAVSFKNLSTGSTAWQWDLGNGTFSTLKEPSTTYITPGVYTIKLTATNGLDNNIITKAGFITVYANPNVDFGISQLIGCFPVTAIFNDHSVAGSGTITSWQWDFGDGSIANVQNPTHTFLDMGNFNVSLTLKNNFGCSQTLSKSNFVTVTGPLHANFIASTPPPCNIPATIQFTSYASGDSINSYFWDFGDGQTSTEINPTHIYTATGAYIVTYKVGNIKGCYDAAVQTITVGAIKADFYAAGSCINAIVSLNNLSTPGNWLKHCTWAFDDGTADTSANPQKTFSTPGNHLVTLTADFGGCTASITKNIVVLANAVPSFIGDVVAACSPPLTTTFTNTIIGGTAVKWRFGDGYSSELPQPTHTFTSLGDYTVRLTATNANGCEGTTALPAFIHIGSAKILNIEGPPYRGCVPFLANFSAAISPANQAVTYKWYFGDGATSNQPNPSHNYVTEGRYDIMLIITAINGGCTDTMHLSQAVVVGTKPHAAFSASPLIVCPGLNVYFKDSSIGNPDHYAWVFGDGDTSASTMKNPIKGYKASGYQTVTLTVTKNGCTDNVTRQDYIYVKPPDVIIEDSFVCANQHQHNFMGLSNASSFKWDFGDGDTSTLQNPSHFYKDTGRYNVFVQVNTGECPFAFNTAFVLNEKSGFTAVDSVACGSKGKIFTPASDWNILSYTWGFGDGSTLLDSIGNPISHNYAATGTYQVGLEVADLNHCKSDISTPIVVNRYGPKANFNVPPKICINLPEPFVDQSIDTLSNIVKWVWDFDDNSGLQSFGQSPCLHAYNKGGTYSISLIIVDAIGCSDTLYKPDVVTVQSPKANFVAADTVYCLSAGLQFYNYSAGNIVFSHWNFGDGDTSDVISPNHIYTQAGRFNVKLNIIDDAGCKADTTINSFINIADTKAIFWTGDSSTTCPPLVSTFINQSINLANAKWDFGDGSASILTNTSHIYTLPGQYTVKLIATGYGGCVDSAMKKIHIAGPVGDFSYTQIKGCMPMVVTFNSHSANAAKYIWDFDDGKIDSLNATTMPHDYINMGTYLPKMILQDSTGCKVPIFGKDSIVVKGVETHIKNLPKYLYCDSGLVSFIDSTITNDVVNTLKWTFGDGQTSNVLDPTHYYTSQGMYYVNYQVTTVTGCTSSDSLKLPIKVVQSPKIAFSSPTGLCVPANVQFLGQLLNADTSTVHWSWNFGNGGAAAEQNPLEQLYNKAGQYKIVSIATNGSGCADTVQHVLPIYSLPIVDAGQSKFICPGQSDTLFASGALYYVWGEQASLSCVNCSNPIINPRLNQMYSVVGTDLHGCKAADSVLIQVKQPFTMVVGDGGTLCMGQSFGLHAVGAEAYTWSPNENINNDRISNPIVTPNSSKIYQVIGYDTVGCARDTGFVTINVYPIPTVNILENKLTVTVGSTIQLRANVSPDVTKLHWMPATGLSCNNCPAPMATPKQNTVYTLVATNNGGCTAQDNVDILVVCNGGNIYIPNTFSPNGDGVNDVFYPRGRGIYGIKGLRVFSKWGEMVYEKTNFQANDISSGWDGMYKGQKLAADVFIYIIDVICDNNVLFTLKGNVTLLR